MSAAQKLKARTQYLLESSAQRDKQHAETGEGGWVGGAAKGTAAMLHSHAAARQAAG